MKTANLSDVKNDLSRYVAEVRAGGRVRILLRGVPVADLVPVERASEEDEWGLDELERKGAVVRGKGGIDARLLRPGPKAKGRPTSELLVEDRRAGR